MQVSLSWAALPQIEQKGYSVQYRHPRKKPSDRTKLYLLELKRTVILSNIQAEQPSPAIKRRDEGLSQAYG